MTTLYVCGVNLTVVNGVQDKEWVRQAFAERFREALDELGVSPSEQARLQRLFGVSGQAVRKWLDGSSLPTHARMPLLAEVLGVRRAWLQDGEPPMRPTTGAGEGGGAGLSLSREEVTLVTRYRLLDDRARMAITTIIHSLADGGNGRNG